jgi:glycosyl hydrolase family 2
VVTLRGEAVADDSVELRERVVERSLPLARERLALWTPERPNLDDLRLELLGSGGKTLDAIESYFGMRKIEARDGQVFLNGLPYYQRLVLDQGYFPDGLLTAPADDDLRRDIELAREMGFNGARKHQKVEDPRWLYWADALGFLVWGEMANAYRYSPDYVRRITGEWQEAVRRDYNHPCIVAWVPMNESWGVPDLATDTAQVDHLLTLYHLTKSLDRSRLVVSNDGWEHALTDLCTIHDYGSAEDLSSRYATPESSVSARPAKRPIYAPGHGYRGEPILISEFGGIAFSGEEGWGYSTVAGAGEFLERYEALVTALLRNEAVQGFCYTQLTDVEQEINGLLTYEREPKVDLSRVREVTSRGRP